LRIASLISGQSKKSIGGIAIWPEANAAPKPALDAVLSQAQLEKEVEAICRILTT
jgi:hypothetical protein